MNKIITKSMLSKSIKYSHILELCCKIDDDNFNSKIFIINCISYIRQIRDIFDE